jgi:Aldo/keto reductases, related to diketogulonate reductase
VQQARSVAFCKEHGIAVEAYSPDGAWRPTSTPATAQSKKIAAAHEVSPAQVNLRWHNRKRHNNHPQVRAC